jgi:cellulose synthase/poly-beta-1,6-N-acetylglucosamine synthase-like glycosyltransferase
MLDALFSVFFLFGALCFYFGLASLAYYPLALAYPFWERRQLARARASNYTPPVTVLVPAYNEERTIAASIVSILAADYPDFEVIVVNDGSTDGTEAAVQALSRDARLRYFAKPNGGKASALNVGLQHARGEVVLFTDADSLFRADTIRNGVAYLADPAVGAVSGNDTVLHPRGALQRMLVVTSHIGTGFVRRALSMLGVLQIIPGNLGLVRTEILRRLGGFREVWGEDLEITLRLHRERIRVVYGASTCVLAECPHTITGLWKQRVRWLRSYMKVLRMHRDMIGNPRFGWFGPFLAFNVINMTLIPLLQLVGLLLLPAAVFHRTVDLGGYEWIAYLGLGMLFAAAVASALLDRAPRDLVCLPYALLLLVFSHFYNAVVLYSLWAERRGHTEAWNKLERRDLGALARAMPVSRLRFALATAAALAVAFGVGYWLGHRPTPPAATAQPLPLVEQEGTLAVATHFEAWRDWRDAYETLIANPYSRYINRVAVSAGRADWTYFRWKGEERWWSPEQARNEPDMLDTALERLEARGYRTTAILDVFAARYLGRHPDEAAVDVEGKRSREIVCSTVLAEGAYGEHLERATQALAGATRADTVAVTELFYDKHCFDDRCLLAFRKATGRSDWPRTADGRVDLLDPALGAWRSRQVASVVERLSRVVRAQGKKFAFDVKLSRDTLFRNSAENGQDYRLLAPHVDEFVVWNYYALENQPPEVSARAAAYFADEFGPDGYFLSLGLWGQHTRVIPPESLARALHSAREGGARHLWITPYKDMTEAHWRVLAESVGRGKLAYGASRSER